MAELGDSITDILLSGSTASRLAPTDIAGAMLRAKAGRSSYGEELNRVKAQKITESNDLMKTMTYVMERKQKQDQLRQQGWEKAAEAFRTTSKDMGITDHPEFPKLGALVGRAFPYNPDEPPPSPMNVAQWVTSTAGEMGIRAQTKEEAAASSERGRLLAQSENAATAKTPEELLMTKADALDALAANQASQGNDTLAKRQMATATILRQKAMGGKTGEIAALKAANPGMTDQEATNLAYGMVKAVAGNFGVETVDLTKLGSAPQGTAQVTQKSIKEASDTNVAIRRMLPLIPELRKSMANAVGAIPKLSELWGNIVGQLPGGDAAVDPEVVKAKNMLRTAVQQFINTIPLQGERNVYIRKKIEAMMPDPESWLTAPETARQQIGQVEEFLRMSLAQNEQTLKRQPIEQPSSNELKKISTDAEYDALPSGTVFIDPRGVKRKKP